MSQVPTSIKLLLYNPAPFHRTAVETGQSADQIQAGRENSARAGYSEHRFNTRGVGVIRVAEPLSFDIPFLAEPHFTSGCALVHHPNPNTWSDPSATVGVRMWVRNQRGHYVGAYVYAKVAVDLINPSGAGADTYPVVQVIHFATFSGLAFKDLGSSLTSQAAQLQPRVPGFGSNQ